MAVVKTLDAVCDDNNNKIASSSALSPPPLAPRPFITQLQVHYAHKTISDAIRCTRTRKKGKCTHAVLAFASSIVDVSRSGASESRGRDSQRDFLLHSSIVSLSLEMANTKGFWCTIMSFVSFMMTTANDNLRARSSGINFEFFAITSREAVYSQ